MIKRFFILLLTIILISSLFLFRANASVYTTDNRLFITSKYSPKEIAQQIIDGKWGDWPLRQENIEKAGYNYSEIQDMVNKLLKQNALTSISSSSTSTNVNTGSSRNYSSSSSAKTVNTTNSDAEYIAKTIYGEANFLSEEERAQVAWCILNRVDSEQYPDTVSEVVTQNSQFHGYRSSNPVTEENLAIAEDVLERWGSGSDDRELDEDMLYFYGDGHHNYFRSEW